MEITGNVSYSTNCVASCDGMWTCVMSERRTSPVTPPHIDVASCTVDYRERLLSRLPLFRDLAPPAVSAINRRFRDVGYNTDDTIIREGDTVRTFHIIAVGVATVTRTTSDGETVVLDVLTRGETFGSVAGFGPERYTENVIAGSTVCVLQIDTARFRSIIEEHPSVAMATIDFLSQRLRLSQEMVTQLGGYPARPRVAYVILRLAEKLGHPWEGKTLIGASFRRDQLASMAGTTTETCSRIISDFRRKGLVDSGREWIAVRDMKGLRDEVPVYS